MEDSQVCTRCNNTSNAQAIFCSSCGHNLQLPKKIQSLSEISYKNEIEEDYIVQYMELNKKIGEFDGFELEASQQKQHLEFLFAEYNREKNTMSLLISQAKAEKQDVEKLKVKKWGTIKARISGDYQSLLEKEEQEYFEALNRLESSEKKINEIAEKIKVAQSQYEEIQKVLEKKDLLLNQQKEIIYRAAEGIKDETEDQIELKLGKLSEKLEPYLLQKSKLQTANSFIGQSIEFLISAKSIIDNNNAEAGKIVGNGLLSETVKSSQMADVRNSISLAKETLDEASDFIRKTKLTPDIEPLEGSQFWEEFLKQFIQELSKGEKVLKSTNLITKAIGQANQISSWLKSQISNMTMQVEIILGEIDTLQSDLMKQRTRIMQAALDKKSQ